ncbi:hypothetical protein EYF80_026449 [Liparis tanakae]|uniref:Uncharacterized protein n=1 Tax=Liparis tanakae TaxID=230148 RepID=A0A4Z2HBT3_9TELE|nr:hypothetical protein EYF80_026449 [Liparis tanakae]
MMRRWKGGRDSPEQPGVGGQSGDGDADVVVHMEDLLLVGGQFRLGSLRRHETIRHGLTGLRHNESGITSTVDGFAPCYQSSVLCVSHSLLEGSQVEGKHLGSVTFTCREEREGSGGEAAEIQFVQGRFQSFRDEYKSCQSVGSPSPETFTRDLVVLTRGPTERGPNGDPLISLFRFIIVTAFINREGTASNKHAVLQACKVTAEVVANPEDVTAEKEN